MYPPLFITPQWQEAFPNIGALMTTRLGGVSVAPYNTMNVGSSTQDDVNNVEQNKARLQTYLQEQGVVHGQTPYLSQVHGIDALNLDDDLIRNKLEQGEELEADACFTTKIDTVCAVRIADCMPVLLAVPNGVAAIHAGWRGLAHGIVTKTLEQLLMATGRQAHEVQAWLGPCIGKDQFEVGEDVKHIFEDLHPQNHHAFKQLPSGQKWLGNLPWLVQEELKRFGVKHIAIDGRCTVEDENMFFSYRRDHESLGGTGRMMACIWMKNAL